MKPYKIIAFLLGLEFAYVLSQIIPSFLSTFSSSQLLSYLFIFSLLALFLASIIGIYKNKKWGTTTLWIYILLPLLISMVSPFIAFIGGYYFAVINIAAAIYLSLSYRSKVKAATPTDTE